MGGLAFIGGILLIIVGLLWCSIQDNGVKETGFVILAIIASAIIVGALMYIYYLLITYPKELFTVILYIILSIVIFWCLSLVFRMIFKPTLVNPKIRYILKKSLKKYDNNNYILSDFNKKSEILTKEELFVIDIFNQYIANEYNGDHEHHKANILYDLYNRVSDRNLEQYILAINSMLSKIVLIQSGKKYILQKHKLISPTITQSDRYRYDNLYRQYIDNIALIATQVKTDMEQYRLYLRINYFEDIQYYDTISECFVYKDYPEEYLFKKLD